MSWLALWSTWWNRKSKRDWALLQTPSGLASWPLSIVMALRSASMAMWPAANWAVGRVRTHTLMVLPMLSPLGFYAAFCVPRGEGCPRLAAFLLGAPLLSMRYIFSLGKGILTRDQSEPTARLDVTP